MSHAVLVRDPRHPIGGLETWVEALAALLPPRDIRVTMLRPANDDAVLEELAKRAQDGDHGIIFTLGYPYLAVAAINLIGSPWVSIPVLHGRDPGAYDWLAVGPARRIVVPNPDLAAEVHVALRERVGAIRSWHRVVMIPHGVPVPADIDRPDATPGEPLRVIVVSRLEDDVKRASDYARIIEATSELPLEFTIIGDGSALPALRERIGDRARLLGAQPRERVYEELLASDVLLSTSSSEAFGLSVAEGMACGCAVIAADAGPAFRELVLDGGGSIVRAGDIEAFAYQLRQYLANPNAAREAGKRGHALVRDFYSQERMGDAYAQLIRSIPTAPNRQWQAPGFRTPADAIPRTLGARISNWTRALSEAFR